MPPEAPIVQLTASVHDQALQLVVPLFLSDPVTYSTRRALDP